MTNTPTTPLRREFTASIRMIGKNGTRESSTEQLRCTLAVMSNHQWLAELSGAWSGTVRTWLDPTAPPLENTVTGTFRRAFDGPTVVHEYSSHVGDKRSDGMMIVGTDIETNQPSLTWVDTFHTGGNVMTLRTTAGSEELTFAGAYAAGPEEVWRWRITVRQASTGEVSIDHVNITSDGEEAPAIEVRLRRA